MSKGHRKKYSHTTPDGNGNAQQSERHLKKKAFITSSGHRITLSGINNMLLQRVGMTVEFPEVPKYSVETAYGDVEWHDHNETTLETDEDKEAWEQYQQEHLKAQYQQVENVTKLLLTRGVIADVPDEAKWRQEQEFFGIELPSDPMELRMHYITTEVIGSEEELVEMLDVIMELSNIPREVLDAAQESFRSGVEAEQEPARDATDGGDEVEEVPERQMGA